MEAHLLEWLNLVVRWVHMIVGIAWIGASFYFVWLENNLNRVNPKDGLAGDLWAIHGGGIYHLEKYKLAPPSMPEHLHWFKWEAYSTWLSGVALLTVVYYLNPTLYLIAPGSGLTPGVAVVLGLGSLVVGWFFYDALCESVLGKHPLLLGVVLFVLLVLAAYAFTQVFSGRGAYLHVGAIIGTIMVGNVLRIIMPAQRALVAAIAEGRTPDPSLPAKGLLRSRHNNYFTLPVLFIMISNHFPSTYGSHYNWLILAGIAVLAVMVRHYFNTRHNSHKFAWTLPVAALGMLCLAYITGPTAQPPRVGVAAPAPSAFQPIPATAVSTVAPAQAITNISVALPSVPVIPNASAPTPSEFAQVQAIVHQRCTVCHSAQPSSELFSTAPAGVMFDSAEQIHQLAPRIQAQAVNSPAMPLGNITGMTQAERDFIGAWVTHGAPLQ